MGKRNLLAFLGMALLGFGAAFFFLYSPALANFFDDARRQILIVMQGWQGFEALTTREASVIMIPFAALALFLLAPLLRPLFNILGGGR